jgi:prefoldin beta subunit
MEENEELKKYQQVRESLEAVALEASAINQSLAEYELALKEAQKSSGKLYKLVGSLLIEVSKEEAEKEIKEKQEELRLRLEMLKKKNEKLIQMENELREKLQKK